MAAKTAAGYGSRELAKFRATGMADLGIQPHVIEAVLNHVSGHKAGVAGIYNRSTYAKRETSGDGPVGGPYSGYCSPPISAGRFTILKGFRWPVR